MCPRTAGPAKVVAEQVESSAGRRKQQSKGKSGCMSSGSILLNLACSGNAEWMAPQGSVINIVGDRSTGKSLLCLTMAAEAANNQFASRLDIVYDDVEASCKFPLEKMFGKKFMSKVKMLDKSSDTIEEFDGRFRSMMAGGNPLLYFLDSYDAITSEEELEHLAKEDKARADGGKRPGTYGQSKPKRSSQFFRVCKREVWETGSILVIVSQVRENLESMGPWSPKFKRSGGKALDHNADLVIWLASVKRHKRRGMQYGYRLEAKIDKNKITGKRRTVQFDVFDQYGIDDIGSTIDFLVAEGWWRKSKDSIVASELGLSESRDGIISWIEGHPDPQRVYQQVRCAAQECWDKIEASVEITRKRRFE